MYTCTQCIWHKNYLVINTNRPIEPSLIDCGLKQTGKDHKSHRAVHRETAWTNQYKLKPKNVYEFRKKTDGGGFVKSP